MTRGRAGLLFLAGLLIGAASAAVVAMALSPDGNGHARARQADRLPAARSAVRPGRTAPVAPAAGVRVDTAGALRVSDAAARSLDDWTEAARGSDRPVPTLGAVLELYALAGRREEFLRTARGLLEIDPEAGKRVLQAVELAPGGLKAALLEELVATCPALEKHAIYIAGQLAGVDRLDRAFEVFALGLRLPDAPEKLSDSATLLLLNRDPARAGRLMVEAARAGAWEPSAWNRLAGLLAGVEGGHDVALLALRTAIQIGAVDSDTLSTALEIDPATAEALALRSIESDPKDSAPWWILGEARKRRGDQDGAFLALVQYARLQRGREALEVLLGLDPGRALAVVAELTADTSDDEAIGALAINYKELGRIREAWDTYYRAHLIDPSDSEWLSEMVALDPVRSVEVFEKRIKEGYGRNSDEMLGAYAQALLGAGRTEDAWEQFVEAWKLDSSDSEWIDGMGEIDPHRTIALLKEELERNPGNDTAFSSIAKLLGKVGRPEEALGMMRQLIERTPSPTGWLMSLSETMPAEAEVLTRQKLQKYPRDDELWGTLGKILFNQGRNDDALVAFRKANEIDPGDSEWHGYFQQMGVPIPRGGTSEVVIESPFEEDPLPPR